MTPSEYIEKLAYGGEELRPNTAARTVAENNTTVAIDGIMLTIASKSDPREQFVAVLNKSQASQIINALAAAHKIENH